MFLYFAYLLIYLFSSYDFVFNVSGNPPLYSEAAITIRVGVPGNQRPVFRSPTASSNQVGPLYHAEVREDAPPNSAVVQVIASDPDGQDSLITYSIASGARDNFNVDAK